MVNLSLMARRILSLTLPLGLSLCLSSCSWFQNDNDFQATAPPPAAGELPQVTPAGQTPAVPGAPGTQAANAFGAGGYAAPGTQPGALSAAPAAVTQPIANEQFVKHTIVSGDSLWKLARTYRTSVQRITDVNGLTNDKIIAGQTITIPTTSPPPGAQSVAAPVAAPVVPATPAPTTTTLPAIPSATNPVVRPLPTTLPAVGPREPIAIPRPEN
jgi:LysM repeat protein